MKVVRDKNNNIAYKLYENKLYNTTTVKDSTGKLVAKINNNSISKTTVEKLRKI